MEAFSGDYAGAVQHERQRRHLRTEPYRVKLPAGPGLEPIPTPAPEPGPDLPVVPELDPGVELAPVPGPSPELIDDPAPISDRGRAPMYKSGPDPAPMSRNLSPVLEGGIPNDWPGPELSPIPGVGPAPVTGGRMVERNESTELEPDAEPNVDPGMDTEPWFGAMPGD